MHQLDSPSDPEPDTESGLTLNELFHILQNDRRRRALSYVQQVGSPVEMSAITDQVAAWEHNIDPDDLSHNQRQRVYIALYQNHLPTLDEHDVIDYDQDRGIVERSTHAAAVEYYLEGPLAGRDSQTTPARPDDVAATSTVDTAEIASTTNDEVSTSQEIPRAIEKRLAEQG